ncbi:hypothetical protein QYF36_005003 [Acer negundo]|nr:hypothetical protein QYF36_005003 [Acer negundo]
MFTQVFILCDKLKDATLILISFMGTEPFDADDWITYFDFSWYEFPELGKVHMGSLEALGNRKVMPEMRDMSAYYAVKEKLKDLLKEHKNAKFVATGHSLGRALSIQVAHEEKEVMQSLLGVYTFGQPRVSWGGSWKLIWILQYQSISGQFTAMRWCPGHVPVPV